jgi:predicted RNA-binding protein
MCESTIYVTDKPGEPLMKDAVMVIIEGDQIEMRNILGSRKVLRGKIVKVDFLNHALFVREC